MIWPSHHSFFKGRLLYICKNLWKCSPLKGSALRRCLLSLLHSQRRLHSKPLFYIFTKLSTSESAPLTTPKFGLPPTKKVIWMEWRQIFRENGQEKRINFPPSQHETTRLFADTSKIKGADFWCSHLAIVSTWFCIFRSASI